MIAANPSLQFGIQLLDSLRRPRYRSMLEFAEQEIRIPSGQHKDKRFKVSRQPFAKLWFDAVADQKFHECVITGPSQSGKTLIGFVIPLIYHIFELGQDVIGAVPDFDMVFDKWSDDILPVLERTRYREYLPRKDVTPKQSKIKFTHGKELRWMTAGGGDKSRAGYTAPVICMTETDGFDVRQSTSDEANKISQIEARMRGFPLSMRRIYKECTVTVAEAHTWDRYQKGTHSKIVLQCPHCYAWVTPERDHFIGWQSAETDAEAVENSGFFCYECGVRWSEAERNKANQNAYLLHAGQKIRDNQVSGKPKNTRTLGFRWSAVNNLLVPASDLGLDEFNAARAVDEDEQERKMAQFVWCVPYSPKGLEEVPLTQEDIVSQSTGLGRGVCPDDTEWITVGVDVNKPVLHWTAIAWIVREQYLRGHIIDFGKQGVRQDEEWQDCLLDAIRKLSSNLGKGWSGIPEHRQAYSRVVIDSRWSTDLVANAVRKLQNRKWKMFQGMGSGSWKKETYRAPKRIGGTIKWVGAANHEEYVSKHKQRVNKADANWWKTWLHTRLLLKPEPGEEYPNGSVTIFESVDETGDLLHFAKHLTAEKEKIDFERGRGQVREWVAVRRANHWLDSTYMACVAGNYYWNSMIKKTRRPVAPGMRSTKGNTISQERSFG